jgi:hypothetical protein
MTILEVALLSFAFTVLVTAAGWVWRLATRISKAEDKADAASTRADIAGINVAANSMKVEKVASELAQHREDTAKDYVSYKHMVNLENRLIDAISQLGNRIDGLFTRVNQHA